MGVEIPDGVSEGVAQCVNDSDMVRRVECRRRREERGEKEAGKD